MKASLLLLPSLLIVASSAWMPPAAIAGSETCKNVEIKLINATKDEIKLTKLEYDDSGQYRTEIGVFGVDGKQKLQQKKSFEKTRDLKKVNDEQTHIRVTYRHLIGGDKYESPVTQKSSTFTCRDNMKDPITIVLTN